MKKYLNLAVGALILLTQSAFAIPVIPDASGFGIETPAGRGGQVIKVTNLNSSGAGSLKACIDAVGPRVCVFEVAGNINIANYVRIVNPNITIAGQSAPHPGITLLGGLFRIGASDVLIQHIAIRAGDDPDGLSPNVRDTLGMGGYTGTIRNIVIDHCSFTWSLDELMSTTPDLLDNVTIRHSVFAFPLHDSIHPDSAPPGNGVGHGYGILLDSGPGKIDFTGNLIAHSAERNPLARMAGFVFRNNVVYNYRRLGTQLINRNNVATNNDIVANVYIEGADTQDYLPVWIGDSSSNTLMSGSRVYESGNLLVRRDGTTSSNVLKIYGSTSVLSNTALFPSLSSQVAPVNAGPFVSDLLANVGRRPGTRDSSDVDARAARETLNRTGTAINCVEDDGTALCDANAGGWPANSNARRTLSIPANPNGDDDGDGYTNLEEWLHAEAVAVETGGGTSTPPPAPTRPMAPELLISGIN